MEVCADGDIENRGYGFVCRKQGMLAGGGVLRSPRSRSPDGTERRRKGTSGGRNRCAKLWCLEIAGGIQTMGCGLELLDQKASHGKGGGDQVRKEFETAVRS